MTVNLHDAEGTGTGGVGMHHYMFAPFTFQRDVGNIGTDGREITDHEFQINAGLFEFAVGVTQHRIFWTIAKQTVDEAHV